MKKLIKITSLIVIFSLVITFFGETNTAKDVHAASSNKVSLSVTLPDEIKSLDSGEYSGK